MDLLGIYNLNQTQIESTERGYWEDEDTEYKHDIRMVAYKGRRWSTKSI